MRGDMSVWKPHLGRSRYFLGAVILVELILCADYHQERWRKALAPLNGPATHRGEGLTIRCDGLGYYAWLRSLLIDGDLSFDNEFDEHNPLRDFVPSAAHRTARNLRPNLWSIGPACIWSCVVVPGHCVVHALQSAGIPWPADGYSLPYQLFVALATVLASFAGLVFLYGICRHYGQPRYAALATALITLGTPILYYSSIEVSMAHGVGTAMVAALICYWLTSYGKRACRRWILVGILLGMTALIRWQLSTFAILPIGESVFGSVDGKSCWRARIRLIGLLALAGVSAAIAFLPQMLAWQYLYGSWIVQPYATAQNWLQPAWIQVLAAEDRGLFYWTPIALLAAIGSLRFLSRGGQPLVLLVLAFVVQVYVVASVWGRDAYLGAAYGFRPLTESLVALAPGLTLLLNRSSRRPSEGIAFIACLCVLWNLLLLTQYRYGWIPTAGGVPAQVIVANGWRLLRWKHFLAGLEVILPPLLLWLGYWKIRQQTADASTSWPLAPRAPHDEIPGCLLQTDPATTPQPGIP